MYSGFVADEYPNILVCGCHVCRHIDPDIDFPSLTPNIHDALQFHCTDESSIAADNPLITQSNATNSDKLFLIYHNMRHPM